MDIEKKVEEEISIEKKANKDGQGNPAKEEEEGIIIDDEEDDFEEFEQDNGKFLLTKIWFLLEDDIEEDG